MSFLPDIDENGVLKEAPPEPKLYTPPTKVRAPDWEADGMRPDRRRVKDLPRMEDMHECVPNEEGECGRCGRIMII